MINVTCAIIVDDTGRVLVTQRSATMKLPFKIEFPGGKIEPGETASDCLVREIKEELNLDIMTLFEMPSNIHHYIEFSINLIPFVCKIIGGAIEMREHASYQWLNPSELLDQDWAEADIPIVENYLNSI
ncbi:(deoxy)nucleoside triphosphate pyrophosphohydrolase [Pedobacter foliorum]|uniref:(deoxy)nucleoside triphosphate pyrophosphohydrolase n=1 Tax=Pedobacter foliorum TaxID=2739058 RepID=UPI001564F6B5|nr:(deoxy)nucleoside triphosphate pyrophosphohydrolase [Pedobacter foliorum]NRF37082.1 (deoxy)nucleoside triphosphate pyrophosphohydrolase [Pedobacter foliorum]